MDNNSIDRFWAFKASLRKRMRENYKWHGHAWSVKNVFDGMASSMKRMQTQSGADSELSATATRSPTTSSSFPPFTSPSKAPRTHPPPLTHHLVAHSQHTAVKSTKAHTASQHSSSTSYSGHNGVALVALPRRKRNGPQKV